MATVGNLKVLLTMSAVGFYKELTESEKKAKKFKDNLNNVFRATAIGVGAFVGAVTAVKKVLAETVDLYADNAKVVDEFARAMGVGSAEASTFLEIADDLEIETTALKTGFRNLNDEGIAPNIENLMNLAAQYQSLSTSTEKAQFATDLFGAKAGPELQKLLEQTPEDIRAMADEAKAMGLVMSDDGTAAAKEYRLSVDAVSDAVRGLKYAIAEDAMPAATEFNNFLVDIIQGNVGNSRATFGQGVVDSMEASILRSSDSFEVFIQRMAEVGIESGRLEAKGMRLNAQFYGTAEGADVLAQVLHTYTAEEFRAAKENMQLSSTMDLYWAKSVGYIQNLAKMPDVYDEMAASEEYARQASIDHAAAIDVMNRALLDAGLKGEIQALFADYGQTVADLTEQEAGLRQELADGLAQGWEPTDERVQELNEKLGENARAQQEAAAEAKRHTAELLMQQVAASMTGDAALELARKLGLISEIDYQVAKATMDLTAKYDANKDGLIDAGEAASGFQAAMLLLNDALADGVLTSEELERIMGNLDGLTADMTINITTNGYIPDLSVAGWTPGQEQDEDFIYTAEGYHGWVDEPTPIIAGEAGAEYVDITPAAEMGAGGSGDSYVFHFHAPVNRAEAKAGVLEALRAGGRA